jgi:hypothetical protein
MLKATRRTLFADRELSPTIRVSSVAVARGAYVELQRKLDVHLSPAEYS